MAARKYDGKRYIDFPHSPPEVKQMNHDQYNKQKKKYEGVDGGSFEIGIGDGKYVQLLVSYTPHGASTYISTEVNGTGLDELYRLYPGGVQWATFMQEAQDVYYDAPTTTPAAPAATVYGPPTFIDQLTFTKAQIDQLGVTFLSHKNYAEKKENVRLGIVHTGKFLLRLFNSGESDKGWLQRCSYFVVRVESKKGGEYTYYATEKEDDPKEQGRYFYERENFPSGAIGEAAFQAYTITQGDFWGWEMKVAADKSKEVAAEVVETIVEEGEKIVKAGAEASVKFFEELLEFLLTNPLILALFAGAGYLAYLYVSK